MTSQEKTEEYPFADIFSEDEIERNFLLSKPVCFAVFGKPGVGKTTLANQIAQTWKCIRVEALPVLEEYIAVENELGSMLKSMLFSGQSIPDELVIKLILEKINSPEVSHFGYIITEIPSLSQDAMTALQQIELIKNLKFKPDVIINIKCPDYDLCQRISGQRQHSSTGYIYTRDHWDPEVIESRRKKKKELQKEGKGEDEGEEEEEQEEEEAFIAEMQMVAEILQHLVQRPEDYLENVENTVKLYKETTLQVLEEVMAEHNPQYLIELEGNKPPEELYMTVLERLKHLNLKRAAIITKLQSAEEEIDIMENEELLRVLASYKMIAPRYRWQRSRWGRACPVALKDGNIYPGLPDFSVSFLGKLYCLSSEEALKAFSLNPRRYLLPPMPAPPCKVVVCGPQRAGKTTLADLIAEHYKGKVVDYSTLVQPRFEKAREMLIENTITEATEAAIRTVKERLLAEQQAKIQAETTLREFQKHFGRKEFEEFSELHSSFGEEASIHDSLLEVAEEAKTKSENVLDDQDEKDISETSTFKRSSQDHSQDLKTYSDKAPVEVSVEVTANHPAVISILEETIKTTKDLNFEQPYEKHAEILEEVLREVMEENQNRFPGAPKYGGWILDNCPIAKELWLVLAERGLVPDLIVYLSDFENNGKCLYNRIYLKNKSEIDAKILERLIGDIRKKKREEAAARKAKEEALRIEEENRRLINAMNEKAKEIDEGDNEEEDEVEGEESEAHEESEAPYVSKETRGSLPEESDAQEIEPESVSKRTEDATVEKQIPKKSKESLEMEELGETVVLPEFPEDAYPDVPEMEPFKEKINSYSFLWKQLEPLFHESSIQILYLDIASKTPKELLQKVVETMEKSFQYTGWELTVDDYDEEAEDYQAEAEVEEELEEEEEEEEENEDRIKEKKRHLGDTKHFCPVVLKENFVLHPGNVEEAVKYREKIYYFSSAEAKDKFLEHPEDYVAHEEPLKGCSLRCGSSQLQEGRMAGGDYGVRLAEGALNAHQESVFPFFSLLTTVNFKRTNGMRCRRPAARQIQLTWVGCTLRTTPNAVALTPAHTSLSWPRAPRSQP
nr:adenylate kinase 9 isoform X6 [Oryctolagus cuniculus]